MYSNCLFEAIKAKIKDPKNVYIFKTPKTINENQHWMWKYKDTYQHVTQASKQHWWNYILHKVKFRKVPNYVFDALVVQYTKEDSLKEKIKTAKITKIDFAKLSGSKWTLFWADTPDECFPTEVEYEYFKKVMKCEPIYKTRIKSVLKLYSFEELKKLKNDFVKKDENFYWKLVDYFDPDFEYSYNRPGIKWDSVN